MLNAGGCGDEDAGHRLRGGYHDFTIEHGGLSIYPRLVAAEHHEEFHGDPMPVAMRSLIALLGGGFTGARVLFSSEVQV